MSRAVAVVCASGREGGGGRADGDDEDLGNDAGDVAILMGSLSSTNAHEKVRVNVEHLSRRLRLEGRMSNMLLKMPNFCVTLLCFIGAVNTLVPSEDLSTVHRQLYRHFAVTNDDLSEVGTFDALYDFIGAFENANEKLSATSSRYWCESRYFQFTWSDELLVPTRRCPSPRLSSLGAHIDTPISWSAWQATYNKSDAGATTGGHRRLSETPASASTEEAHECTDDDAELQREEGKTNITCAGSRSHICDTDLGVTLCPLSCGYCSPFFYAKARKYDAPMTTMLPVMVHQTRMNKGDCHDFAKIYEDQPYNYDLSGLPALDGPRHGPALTCVDRASRFEGDYAHEVECPEGGPAEFCTDGKMKVTKKHLYDGEPVYAQFLTEPEKNLEAMKAMQWLDMQTESVVLSTLVYTQDIESFTSLSVIFTVDEAGGVTGKARLISYPDLAGKDKTIFTALLVIANVTSFVGVVLSLYKLYKEPHCDWGLGCFELTTRVAMCVYCFVLQISQLQQVPMALEYDHLLHTILDFHGSSSEEWEEAVQSYFDTKSHIYGETQWLLTHRIAIYLVLYMQFLQLILYFHAHPRMAMLTSTVAASLDMMFHFMILFTILFCMLAFMASWMLGGEVPAFKTYTEAIGSQGRMLFGEWIYADNADELFGGMVVMYWLYAITFMLVLFFSLLNFFLAIVLDSFTSVQEKASKDPTEMNFFADVFDALRMPFVRRRRKWPTRNALLQALEVNLGEEEASKDRIWSLEDLHAAFASSQARDIERISIENGGLQEFLAHYMQKCSDICSLDEPNHRPSCVSPEEVVKEAQGNLTDAIQAAADVLVPKLESIWGEARSKVFSVDAHGISSDREIVRVMLTLAYGEDGSYWNLTRDARTPSQTSLEERRDFDEVPAATAQIDMADASETHKADDGANFLVVRM